MMVLGYGLGHFVNDLTAACWFNYAFFFLKRVVKTEAASSALLAGQIADGLATIFIGYASDKFNTKYGTSVVMEAKEHPGILGGSFLSLLDIYQLFTFTMTQKIKCMSIFTTPYSQLSLIWDGHPYRLAI